MAKRLRYYDNDKKYIPMTHTDYVRFGSRWKVINEEKSLISRNQAKNILSKQGLPFERSHRLEKRDRWGHNEPVDTFSSISPDGRNKCTFQVDFKKGNENYERMARKSYNDRMRYQRKKKAKQMR